MAIQQKDLSLKFYSFLCDVIGTEEVIDIRRHIFAVTDDLDLDNKEFKGISSGSKAEGLDLKGSDFDQMDVDKRAQVFERFDQVRIIEGKLPLVMDTENTPIGFTKLLSHHPQTYYHFSKVIETRTGIPYLSSTLFIKRVNMKCPGFYIHGPCTTNPSGDHDLALSLHCQHWISEAQQWIVRTKYSWASDKVIRNILGFGVLFVPIGSKGSVNTDLEWRISFSYAEKLLIFSFNHVQLLCYALLKILLKDIIKKIFEDLLCSYFMKTIMFWLCEETELSYWKEENMLSCFMTCLQRLVYCVENKTCLHYFIPENNLFEHRFENQHSKLLTTLCGLYDQGWTCLLQTETLQSFRRYLEPSLSSDISLATFLPCLKFLDTTVISNYNYQYTANCQYTAALKRCIYQIIRSTKGLDIYIYVISSMCESYAQKGNDANLVQSNNRVQYKHFRKCLSNLLISLNLDAVSGWLLLASFFFTDKQYTVFKTVIDHFFKKFTQKIYFSNLEVNCLTPKMIIGKENLNTVDIVENCSIIPNELRLLLENDSRIGMPSFLYAHFLNFLFYHTIGDRTERRKAYRILTSLALTAGQDELVVIEGQIRRMHNCLDIAQNIMHYN